MRPKRNPEVAWRIEKGMRELAWEKARRGEEYEEMGVLTLMHRGAIHQVNLVGAEIWSRLNGINTVRRIAEEVASLFDADAADVEADVTAFLSDAVARGWAILEDAPPPGPKWSGG